jgi:hypothetical protein
MKNNPSKKSEMYAIHKYWADRNFPMTAACCHNGGASTGLISGHAYSLLDIKVVRDGGKSYTLAKLRNPWNKENYKGPWNDNDSRWTSSLKRQVNLVKANDGAFWMPYDSFLKWYWYTAVCLYQNYHHHNFNMVAKTRDTIYRISNPTSQFFYIVGDLHSARNYPRGSCNPRNNMVLYL